MHCNIFQLCPAGPLAQKHHSSTNELVDKHIFAEETADMPFGIRLCILYYRGGNVECNVDICFCKTARNVFRDLLFRLEEERCQSVVTRGSSSGEVWLS